MNSQESHSAPAVPKPSPRHRIHDVVGNDQAHQCQNTSGDPKGLSVLDSSFPMWKFPNRCSMCGNFAEKGGLLAAGQRKPYVTFQRFFYRGATKKLRDHITSFRRSIVSYGCYHHITIVNYIFIVGQNHTQLAFHPSFEGFSQSLL